MKPGLPPTPPDDEAPDPLLATLRQRLGDYGQAPPPAAWAAIRQRVAAPPRPWWRRPRHLLPLLALLLGLLLVSIATERRGQPATATQLAAHSGVGTLALKHKSLTTSGPTQTSTPNRPASPGTSHELAATLPMATGATARLPATAKRRLAPAAAQATNKTAAVTSAATLPTATSAAMLPTASQRQAAATTLAGTRRPRPTSSLASRLRHRTTGAGRYSDFASHQLAAATPHASFRRATPSLSDGRSTRRARRATRQTAAVADKTAPASPLAAGQLGGASARLHPIAAMPTHLPARKPRSRRRGAAHRAGLLAGRAGLVVAGAPTAAAGLAPAPATPAAGTLGLPLFAERGAAIDSLALKQTGLLLPESARPTIPAARLDSTPLAHAGRRWSLLLLAGPTLSYRTLGPAPTLAAGHPDFAQLERPALGLGAQVQVRRVLSGRWAVAVGVGYHEYATRLALSVKDSSTYTTVRQRDIYRLLTVPVQFTYALGAPRGRLAVGLLAGAELGWYVGGRSTEGSDCGCRQQVYPTDSTQASPYRALSLAFSLGLDVRYRLGGPASRWHLVVQPTGRYVATPFVRSEAVGFTRRQPWSLGLLTGFSWDLR